MKRIVTCVFLLLSLYSGALYAGGHSKSIIFNGQTLKLTGTAKVDGNYTLEFIPADQKIDNFEQKLTLCYYPALTITAGEHAAVLKTMVRGRMMSGDPVATAQVMNLDYSYNREAVVYITRSYDDFNKYERSMIYVKKMSDGIMTVEFSRRYSPKAPEDGGVEKFDDDFFKQEEKHLAAMRTTKWPLPIKPQEK
ncbi:MAG: hypothetical protein LLG37_02815 [Spirochaetia bacterium]|nr:hypothetical protein [Spirochaetia bacterium]